MAGATLFIEINDSPARAALQRMRGALDDDAMHGLLERIGNRLFNSLVNYGDHYLLLADYADYMEAQGRVDSLYKTPAEWQRKAILNVAGMGPFSSDRTIREYAIDTWNLGAALKKV